MKANEIKKWYVVKIDNSIQINDVKDFKKRFKSLNKICYYSWFPCWLKMMWYVKRNHCIDITYCVMELNEMFHLVNWLNHGK